MTVGRVFIRDEFSRAVLAEVASYARLEVVDRFNDVGTWTVENIPSESLAGTYAARSTGIIIERTDGTTVSGPATTIRRELNPVRRGGRLTEQVMVTLGGVTDNAFLARRTAHPDTFPYTTSEFDVFTGPAETALHHYAERMVGPLAGARPVAGLTMGPNLARGPTITGKARFDVGLGFLRDLALAGGDFGFRIVQVGSGLVFETYEPRDFSGIIVLSVASRTLISATYEVLAPEVNMVTVGGAGEGTARMFGEGFDANSVGYWGVFETFVDASSADTAGELQQKANEVLAAGAERVSLTAVPRDTDAVRVGRDYWLGDTITVSVEGVDVSQVVREAKVEWTVQGHETVTVALGTPTIRALDPLGSLFNRRLRAVRSDVDRLQRR